MTSDKIYRNYLTSFKEKLNTLGILWDHVDKYKNGKYNYNILTIYINNKEYKSNRDNGWLFITELNLSDYFYNDISQSSILKYLKEQQQTPQERSINKIIKFLDENGIEYNSTSKGPSYYIQLKNNNLYIFKNSPCSIPYYFDYSNARFNDDIFNNSNTENIYHFTNSVIKWLRENVVEKREVRYVSEDSSLTVPSIIKVQHHTTPNPDHTPIKYDQNKTRYDLIPFEVLEILAEQLTKGLEKYPNEDNWKGLTSDKHYNAMMRHLMEHQKGNIMNDNGFSHIDAMFINAMFYWWKENNGRRSSNN